MGRVKYILRMVFIIMTCFLSFSVFIAGAQEDEYIEYKNKIELENITPPWLNFCPADLQVSGDYLFGVDYEVLNVYDISNPVKPIWKNSYRNYVGFDLEMAKGYAFVSYLDVVVSLDIDPPEDIKELSRVEIPGFPYQMHLSGDYLYALADDSDRTKFLHTIDASDPSNIVHLGKLELDSFIRSFKVYDEKTLIAKNQKGIVIIDTSDPKTPKITRTIDGETPVKVDIFSSPSNDRSEVYLSDGYAYATFGNVEMDIFDIEPVETAHFVRCFKFENVTRIVGMNGNTVFTEDANVKDGESWKLQLVDISNRESPVITRTYYVPDPIPYFRFKDN